MSHPVEELMREHRAIEKVLDGLEQQLDPARGSFPAEFVDQALDYFANFADGCHHRKEEDILFPALEARGMPVDGGPIGVMLHEHNLGRQYLAGIRAHLPAARSGSAEAQAQARDYAGQYIALLRNHIWKEDNVLFRMAMRLLSSEQDCETLESGFHHEKAAGMCRRTHQEYEDFALAAAPR